MAAVGQPAEPVGVVASPLMENASGREALSHGQVELRGVAGCRPGCRAGRDGCHRRPGNLYNPSVVNAVRAQPGVAGVEAADWSQMTYRGQTLYALAVHADTFVREPLAAGRWLTVQDERSQSDVPVVGSAAARRWHLHPGSRISVSTAGGPVTFTVIGVGSSQANNGYNIYMPLVALQAATGQSGVANSLLIRTDDKSHADIDSLAARLKSTLA